MVQNSAFLANIYTTSKSVIITWYGRSGQKTMRVDILEFVYVAGDSYIVLSSKRMGKVNKFFRCKQNFGSK